MNNNTENQMDLPDDNKLTIEQLRSFPGCDHYNDKEAAEILDTLHQLAILLYTHNPGNNNSNKIL